MVRIPPHVVEDAIASSPSKYVLCGRDPKNDFLMEPGRVAFTNFSEGIAVVDGDTGKVRECTLQDVGDIARLNDYLSEMDTHEISVGARDVPPETAAVHNTEAQLLNTTKPIGIGPLSGMECKAILRMCAEVVGGADELRARPIVYGGVCPVSPLKLPKDATEVIIECSRWGIPDNILSMAMAGGSSPVTLAGTLVTHNAEVLAGITLAQLVERGSPMMYGSSTTAMDLKLAAASVGSPEISLISAAVAQMARRYMIPSFVAGL
jgi:trimethylamine--corrinoid protein Co-methyltransferase